MRDKNILMVNSVGQYEKIKDEINQNIINSLQEGKFINGPIVKEFSKIVDLTYNLPNVNLLSATCLSLPIHTEVENSSQNILLIMY
jgi:dTDP-4-amino-4,6-dideoxygalactose transaminase